MKRSFLIVLILLSAPLFLSAQSVWEGSCAVGAYNSFPSTGLYGASDSFPQNTLVTVENTQTNQKATVLIIDRLNNSGLFLLLSKDAGAAIGLSAGEVSQVKVTLAKKSSSLSQGPGDLPYSTDPDVFPAAGVGNPQSLSFLDQYLKGSSGQTSPAPSTSSTQPAQTTTPSAAQTPPSPPTPTSTPEQSAQNQTSTQSPPIATQQPAQETGTTTAAPPKTQPEVAQSGKPTPTPSEAQPVETGPQVSNLSPQPSRQAAPEASAAPPAPELASSQKAPATTGRQATPSPPQPSVSSGTLPSAQTAPEVSPGSTTQEVPSGTGVAQGGTPGTAPPEAKSPALPTVEPSTPSGPEYSTLKPVPTPRESLPQMAALEAPAAPERAGGAPVVSPLQTLETPSAPTQVAMAGPPALPSIRNPGPMTSGVEAARPPAAQPQIAAVDIPSAPEGTPTGPQVSELAQIAPSTSPFSATVSALPSIPSRPQPEAQQPTTGPLVSALAQAVPPSNGVTLADSGLPTPEISGLTPDVTRLASGKPAVGESAPSSVAEVPAVPAPKTVQGPTTTGIEQASAPEVAEGTTPAPAPAAPSKPTQAPSASAPSGAAQAPAVAKAGRIPVRPSTALSPASYYVQLGVYGESRAALALADNLSPDYPVSVYAFTKDQKSLYKVMIGPLNSDESGTLLYLFMAQGYKDAFVRKGN